MKKLFEFSTVWADQSVLDSKGKSSSEALILASTNPQYYSRLFMELPWKLPMFCAIFCVCSFHGNFMSNLLSYCGLVDARISDSEKDLPVIQRFFTITKPFDLLG